MGVEEEKHGRRGVQGLEVPWCGVCATGVGRNQQLGALCAGYLSVIICVAAWKAVTSTSSGVDIAGADACGACCLYASGGLHFIVLLAIGLLITMHGASLHDGICMCTTQVER